MFQTDLVRNNSPARTSLRWKLLVPIVVSGAARIFQRLLSDRSGTVAFFHEVEEMVEKIRDHDGIPTDDLARILHTVKGNCAVFGVERIAALCHELEDRLPHDGSLAPKDRARLVDAWSQFSRKIGALLGNETNRGNIVLDQAEYERYVEQLVRGCPRSELANEILRWRYDRVKPRLERLGARAKERPGESAYQA